MLTKDAVNRAFELPLTEGVRYERRIFHSVFGAEDQKEGMAAFVEKRKPAFRNRSPLEISARRIGEAVVRSLAICTMLST